MDEHSPTPWTVDQQGRIIDARGLQVFYATHNNYGYALYRDVGQLVVRAVNNHEALLAACERLAAIVAEEFDCGGDTESIKRYQDDVDAARAAIAAAKDPS